MILKKKWIFLEHRTQRMIARPGQQYNEMSVYEISRVQLVNLP